jgi:hypothetical protein
MEYDEVKEVKKRIRRVTADIMEKFNRATLIGVWYGSMEKKYDRRIQIIMTRIKLNEIYKIINIMKGHGLRVQKVYIYELKGNIAIEIFFDLQSKR